MRRSEVKLQVERRGVRTCSGHRPWCTVYFKSILGMYKTMLRNRGLEYKVRTKRRVDNRQTNLQFNPLLELSFLTLLTRTSEMRRGERDRADPNLILSTSHIPHPSKRVQGLDYPEPTTAAWKSQ
jgi:hypothetical protein